MSPILTLYRRLDRDDASLTSIVISSVNDLAECHAWFPAGSTPRQWVDLGKRLCLSSHLTNLVIELTNEDVEAKVLFRLMNAISIGLKGNTSIRWISFRGIAFARRHNKTFFQLISNLWTINTNITSIHLQGCTLDAYNWMALGRSLMASRSLKTVIFDDTELTGLDLLACSPALRGSLTKLNMTNTGIGDDEVDILTNLWTIDSTVPSSIDLSDNPNITHETCKHLSRIMSALNILTMADNDIGNTGVQHLLYCPFIDHSSLTSLNLQNTSINDNACFVIEGTLFTDDNKYALEELILDDNDISDKGVEAISRGLTRDRNLSHLSIQNNGRVTNEGWKSLLTTLCNVSSVTSTYESSHHLQRVLGPDYETSQVARQIKQMLSLNSEARQEVFHALSFKLNTALNTVRHLKQAQYYINTKWGKYTQEHVAGVKKLVLSHLMDKPTFLDQYDEEYNGDRLVPSVLECLSKNNDGKPSILTAAFNIILNRCHLLDGASNKKATPFSRYRHTYSAMPPDYSQDIKDKLRNGTLTEKELRDNHADRERKKEPYYFRQEYLYRMFARLKGTSQHTARKRRLVDSV